MVEERTALERKLEELAQSRGLSGLEELCAVVKVRTGKSLNTKRPKAGFGNSLDAVLGMDERERVRVAVAFAETFMPVHSR